MLKSAFIVLSGTANQLDMDGVAVTSEQKGHILFRSLTCPVICCVDDPKSTFSLSEVYSLDRYYAEIFVLNETLCFQTSF